MIQKALEYLVNLGDIKIISLFGQQYSTKQILHVKEPSPADLDISTLTGLVGYIKSGIDLNAKLPDGDCEASKINRLLVQVVSPVQVRLYSPLKDDASRNCYIDCQAQTPNIRFNEFLDTERFNIMLQSCFIPTDDAGAVLKIVGNIKEEQVRETGDDGISQEVIVKAGIARVASIQVPNPVVLKPFRTFTEVDQPESRFIFRMQSGPKAALYEADGGAWKLEAMHNIKEYLEKELQGYSVKIIS